VIRTRDLAFGLQNVPFPSIAFGADIWLRDRRAGLEARHSVEWGGIDLSQKAAMSLSNNSSV
jgi:hypothetical protein